MMVEDEIMNTFVPKNVARDASKYYYTFGCRQPEENGIGIYNPRSRKWEFYVVYHLLFGALG